MIQEIKSVRLAKKNIKKNGKVILASLSFYLIKNQI